MNQDKETRLIRLLENAIILLIESESYDYGTERLLKQEIGLTDEEIEEFVFESYLP